MTNEEFQRIVLEQLQTLNTSVSDLKEGQISLEKGMTKLEARQANVEKGQESILTQLRYVWEDIKRIDDRLAGHEQELALLKNSQ